MEFCVVNMRWNLVMESGDGSWAEIDDGIWRWNFCDVILRCNYAMEFCDVIMRCNLVMKFCDGILRCKYAMESGDGFR